MGRRNEALQHGDLLVLKAMLTSCSKLQAHLTALLSWTKGVRHGGLGPETGGKLESLTRQDLR